MYIKKMRIFNFWHRRNMKWPEWLIMVRHDVSAYNLMKIERAKDPLYRRFVAEYEKDHTSAEARRLAGEVRDKWALNVSDANTPLADINSQRAINTGRNLRLAEKLPDVIFVSPYLRTRQTLEALMIGWPELRQVRVYEEERIREQEHGLSSLFNDWKIFHVMYPDQKDLHQIDGSYWYQWPQGERVPEVRDRIRSWMTTLTRDFCNKRILAVTHHLAKLSVRANFERWDANEFQRIDREDRPINCGVTKYAGIPHIGKNGKFAMEYYNADMSS